MSTPGFKFKFIYIPLMKMSAEDFPSAIIIKDIIHSAQCYTSHPEDIQLKPLLHREKKSLFPIIFSYMSFSRLVNNQ